MLDLNKNPITFTLIMLYSDYALNYQIVFPIYGKRNKKNYFFI